MNTYATILFYQGEQAAEALDMIEERGVRYWLDRIFCEDFTDLDEGAHEWMGEAPWGSQDI